MTSPDDYYYNSESDDGTQWSGSQGYDDTHEYRTETGSEGPAQIRVVGLACGIGSERLARYLLYGDEHGRAYRVEEHRHWLSLLGPLGRRRATDSEYMRRLKAIPLGLLIALSAALIVFVIDKAVTTGPWRNGTVNAGSPTATASPYRPGFGNPSTAPFPGYVAPSPAPLITPSPVPSRSPGTPIESSGAISKPGIVALSFLPLLACGVWLAEREFVRRRESYQMDGWNFQILSGVPWVSNTLQSSIPYDKISLTAKRQTPIERQFDTGAAVLDTSAPDTALAPYIPHFAYWRDLIVALQRTPTIVAIEREQEKLRLQRRTVELLEHIAGED